MAPEQAAGERHLDARADPPPPPPPGRDGLSLRWPGGHRGSRLWSRLRRVRKSSGARFGLCPGLPVYRGSGAAPSGPRDGSEVRPSLPPRWIATHWWRFRSRQPWTCWRARTRRRRRHRPRSSTPQRQSRSGTPGSTIASAVDSGEAAVAAARAFTRSLGTGSDSVDAGAAAWGCWGGTLAYRGHLLGKPCASSGPTALGLGAGSILTAAELVTLSAVSPDSAAAWLESLLREGSPWSPLGLPWWSFRGDTGSIRRLDRLARSRSRSSPVATGEAGFWSYQALAAQPFLALARRDTSLALTLLCRAAGLAVSLLLFQPPSTSAAPVGPEAGCRGGSTPRRAIARPRSYHSV